MINAKEAKSKADTINDTLQKRFEDDTIPYLERRIIEETEKGKYQLRTLCELGKCYDLSTIHAHFRNLGYHIEYAHSSFFITWDNTEAEDNV